MELECRICYLSKDPHSLIHPCLCKGTMKWVHHDCLAKFIELSGNYQCNGCLLTYSVEKYYNNKWKVIIFALICSIIAYTLINIIYYEYSIEVKIILTIFFMMSATIMTNLRENYDQYMRKIDENIEIISNYFRNPDSIIIHNQSDHS